jgi:choline kinase
MKAAILVAGRETRPLVSELPKTLVPVGGVPILRRAIASLMRAGFDQFVIATGHREAQVRAAVESWFPGLDVTLVENTAFASTNNAHSLALLRPHLDREPFLLVDGDLVFDVAVVEAILARGPDTIAVRTVGAMGVEDVKVTADRTDRVLAIGKHVPVRGAMGESVGMQLFSAAMSRRLFEVLEHRVDELGLVHEYYEASIQALVDQGETFYGVDLGNLYATEIDTLDDLRAAETRLADRPAFDVGAPVRMAV